MLLIISESIDSSTNSVLEWLNRNQYFNFLRINEKDSINIHELKIDGSGLSSLQIRLNNGEQVYSLDNISFVWYRRGDLYKNVPISISNSRAISSIRSFLNFEWKVCTDFMMEEVYSRVSLGDYFNAKVNKLRNLKVAVQCGFKIPKTIITESKDKVESISNSDFITKPIGENLGISDDIEFVDLKTKKVNCVKENCYPSLFQINIKKWIELRVFVINDELYTMAIFSQATKQTEIDYRNYDFSKRNRVVPFLLPPEIKKKVLLLMNKLDLNTGSLDLILTPDKEYIFLEVNPSGIFEMVSEPCNYYLEKRVAEHIIDRIEL